MTSRAVRRADMDHAGAHTHAPDRISTIMKAAVTRCARALPVAVRTVSTATTPAMATPQSTQLHAQLSLLDLAMDLACHDRGERLSGVDAATYFAIVTGDLERVRLN